MQIIIGFCKRNIYILLLKSVKVYIYSSDKYFRHSVTDNPKNFSSLLFILITQWGG